jgi:hypothetical protein
MRSGLGSNVSPSNALPSGEDLFLAYYFRPTTLPMQMRTDPIFALFYQCRERTRPGLKNTVIECDLKPRLEIDPIQDFHRPFGRSGFLSSADLGTLPPLETHTIET